MAAIRASDIEIAVARYFKPRVNTIVPNVYWGFGLDYEADLIIVTQSGYAKEVEIKVNKQDLIRDKEKRNWHNGKQIRQLWFAVPYDWDMEFVCEHIPSGAGVLVYQPYNTTNGVRGAIHEVKKAEINRYAPKQDSLDISKLRHLGCMRIWALKEKLNKRR